MTIIAGIDYSMSSPAIAVWDDTKPLTFDNIKLFNRYDVKKYQGVHGNIRIDPLNKAYKSNEERYRQGAEWAIAILKAEGVERVTLEGYAMGSSSGLVFNIAENTAHLKWLMHKAGIPFTTPSPSTVKKQFHGKGNANKPQMSDAFKAKFGVDISEILGCKYAEAPANDMVDAVAIMISKE